MKVTKKATLVIPDMVHPLGKYWEQPSRENITVDEHNHRAHMDKKTMFQLHNYETTNPTGAYEGKMWRRGMILCWYEQDPGDNKYLLTKKLDIVLTD